MSTLLFLSCEHGGNVVPPAFASWFKGAQAVLRTHRGYDLGALDLFQHLKPLSAASRSNRLSRLCIEYNRETISPTLFSPYTSELPAHLKSLLLAGYHAYRDGFATEIEAALKEGNRVVHVSVHSFTPVLNGRTRTCDIGLLYDPAHAGEVDFCDRWRKAIRSRAPGTRVRMNYPYKGTSDGFTRTLRKRFGPDYTGIELEVNQRFASHTKMHGDIKVLLNASLKALLRA